MTDAEERARAHVIQAAPGCDHKCLACRRRFLDYLSGDTAGYVRGLEAAAAKVDEYNNPIAVSELVAVIRALLDEARR